MRVTRASSYLLLLMGFCLLCCTAPAQQPAPPAQNEVVGCLSRLPDGTLQLAAIPSGRTYKLQGNTNLLQRHVHQIVAIAAGNGGAAANADTLNAANLRVISDTCTSLLPSDKNILAVEGRVATGQVAPPVTTTASANENTPGYQTEAGEQQFHQQGGSTPVQHYGQANSPYTPQPSEQAGESQTAADTNAQAAMRAEMYPGTTLGVDIKTYPPSSLKSLEQSGKSPEQKPPRQKPEQKGAKPASPPSSQ